MAGITISADSGTQFEAGAAEYNSIARLDDDHYAIAYRDNNDYNKGKVNVGSRTGTSVTISEANAVVFDVASIDKIEVRALTSSLIVIVYRDATTLHTYVIAGTISGTTITLGSSVEVITGGYYGKYGGTIAVLDATNFVVTIGDFGQLPCYVGSVSGTTITLGSVQRHSNAIYAYDVCSVGLDGTHFAVFFSDNGLPKAVVCSVDIGAKTVTFGSLYTDYNLYLYVDRKIFIDAFDDQHFIVGYESSNDYPADLLLYAFNANLSTLVLSRGNKINTSGSSDDKSQFNLCAINDYSFLVSYYTTTGTQGEIRSGTLTGDTTIAWDAQGAVVFDNGTSAYTALCRLTDDYFILGYKRG